MTQPRPHRAGLGLPPAIIIRSDPPPSTRQRELFEEAQKELAEKDWEPNQAQIWAEWNINPARHGPERLTRMPTFVKGTGHYDELGRSAIEGAEVEVDQGRTMRKSGQEQDLSEWYRGLATRRLANDEIPDAKENAVERKPVAAPAVIDLSQEDDETEHPAIDSKPDIASAETVQVTESMPSIKPLRVNQSEWFIRRALLAQDRSTTSSTSSSPGPSSISTMLNIGTSQPRPVAINYVLGPENKGYELLQTRHGWEGGGLGRPDDWQERQNIPEAGPSRHRSPTIELDANGEKVVDLTIDSEDEEEDFALPPVTKSGPGRTAPIATSLKLDRLGLGHQRNKKAARDAEKKVTHTIDEIRRIQQRSRYPPPKQGQELGKKGKIRWKERDKKDREERKRLMAVLNE
jgi:hypothetical protein